MTALLAVLFWAFVGWWYWHHRRYRRGQVDRPFFGKAPPRPRRRTTAPRPRRATPPPKPAPPKRGIVNAGGQTIYIRTTPPAAPTQTPKPPPVPSSPPPPPAPVPAALPPAPEPPKPPPVPEILTVPRTWPKAPPKPKEFPATLLYKLDQLTNDRKASMRLVRKISFNNPDKSGHWCVEKALWDLRRDRF